MKSIIYSGTFITLINDVDIPRFKNGIINRTNIIKPMLLNLNNLKHFFTDIINESLTSIFIFCFDASNITIIFIISKNVYIIIKNK